MIFNKVLLVSMWAYNFVYAYGLCALVMKRRFGKIASVILFLGLSAAIIGFRIWFVIGGGQDAVPAGSMVTMFGCFSLQVILFRGKWFRQLMNYAIVSVFAILAEILASFFASSLKGSVETFNFDDPGFRVGMLLFFPALSVMIYPTIVLLRKVNRLSVGEVLGAYSWLVVTFPLSQMFLINLYTGVTTVVKPIGLIGALVGITSDCLLIWFLDKEHQKFRLRKELEEEKQMLEFEEMTYRDLMSQQEEIAQLRHDYRNQMMALKAMRDR